MFDSFKVVLLGEGSVGKTSLVLRFVKAKFDDSTTCSTLQASFLSKQISLGEKTVTLQIWDTAGQERFHALGPIYYRDSHGAILVYDVTDSDSLIKVRVWTKELRKMLGQNVQLSIVGNKVDLKHEESLIEEARAFATSVSASHALTSAKTNQGVTQMFLDLTQRMFVSRASQEEASQSSVNQSGTSSSQRKTLRIQNQDSFDSENNSRSTCSC